MTMRADEEQWSNLRQFWNSREGKEKVQLTMEKSDILLKGIVKRFFNEKESDVDARHGCTLLRLPRVGHRGK